MWPQQVTLSKIKRLRWACMTMTVWKGLFGFSLWLSLLVSAQSCCQSRFEVCSHSYRSSRKLCNMSETLWLVCMFFLTALRLHIWVLVSYCHCCGGLIWSISLLFSDISSVSSDHTHQNNHGPLHSRGVCEMSVLVLTWQWSYFTQLKSNSQTESH